MESQTQRMVLPSYLLVPHCSQNDNSIPGSNGIPGGSCFGLEEAWPLLHSKPDSALQPVSSLPTFPQSLLKSLTT